MWRDGELVYEMLGQGTDRERGIITGRERSSTGRLRQDPDSAWRYVAWFGLLLAVAGFGDLVIAWVPLMFGSPEWEFGTVVATFAGLPLGTMGLAAMLGSALARGMRWQVRLLGWVVLGLGILWAAAYTVFLTVLPIAVRGAPEGSSIGVSKVVAKTSLLAVAFVTAYVVAGVQTLRKLRSR